MIYKALRKVLRCLRGEIKQEETKYILLPKTFSYKSFYAEPYKAFGVSEFKGGNLADYWHSEEDHHIGIRKEGQITVEGIDGPRQTLDNAEKVIKKLTGAVNVRFTTDLP